MVNCYICKKEADKVLYMSDKGMQSGFCSAMIRNKQHLLCTKCYNKWTQILADLLEYFHLKGEANLKNIEF